MTVKRVLLTGAGGPAGSNFAKCLKYSRSFTVDGIDCNKYHHHLNKYVRKMYYSYPCSHPNYIDHLNQVIDELGIDLIHPQPDIEVKVISDNREKINAKTFLPQKEVINLCQDKFLCAMLWKEEFPEVEPYLVNVDPSFPHLHLIETLLRRHKVMWLRAISGAGGRGSTAIRDVKTALHWLMYWQSRSVKWTFMVQPYLPGRNFAWMSVWKNGQLLTSQGRERLEYIYPNLSPSGITGTPTVARTVNLETLNIAAIKSINMIDDEPNGIYCVDLKEDRYGNICPTEINAGRFHTTSYFTAKISEGFFEYSRANMPLMFLKAAFEQDLPPGPALNVCPDNYYWIRHIDCEPQLIKKDDLTRWLK